MRSAHPPYIAAALALLLSACTQPVPQAPGCHQSANAGTGTDPPGYCFFFPSGAVLDPLGDVLYVSNTNADLSFGGGTVVAVDVLRHERAVQCFRLSCQQDADCDAGHRCNTAIGLCDNASGCPQVRCPQVNNLLTNIEDIDPSPDYDRCYCEHDLSDPNVVNCESFRFVLRDQSIKIGNFSGGMRLASADPSDWDQAPAGTTVNRTLYLPVRGDPSLTYIQVQRTLGDLSAPRPPDKPLQQTRTVQMSCGPRDPNATIGSCSDDFRVQNGETEPLDFSQISRLRDPLPAEPFGVVLDQGCRPDYTQVVQQDAGGRPQRALACAKDVNQAPDPAGAYHFLVMTHLAGGEISAFDLLPGAQADPLLPPSPVVLTSINPGLVPADSAGHRGAFATAPRVPGDLSQPWYVTFRSTGVIGSFRLSTSGMGGGPLVVPGQNFPINVDFANGTDVRDLAFEPGGNRAFLTLDNPPALVVLDTRPDPNASPPGAPANQVIAIADLCPGPSRMALSRTPVTRPSGPPVLQTLLYVACYATGQIAIVDADQGRLLGALQMGGGPVTTVLSSGGLVDPCADPYLTDEEAKAQNVYCPQNGALRPQIADPRSGTTGVLSPRAYVTAYLDNAIGVIDLNPNSRTYQRLVSRIGLPMPKQAM